MPLCPQITITPITVTSTGMTVTSVVAGGDPATTEQVVTAQTTADNAWSASLGKNTVFYQTTAPSTTGRVVGDVWFDTDDGNKMYGWNGSAWVAYQFGTASFQNASVDLSKLADGSVSATKLLDGAVVFGKIAANAVGTNELAANSVVAGKIAASTITGDRIAASTITATNIAAGTITTDKLVAGTLTGFTINNGSGTFQVTSGGNMTSTSGTIGGFTIGSLSLGTPTTTMYASGGASIAATGSITTSGAVSGDYLVGTGSSLSTLAGGLSIGSTLYGSTSIYGYTASTGQRALYMESSGASYRVGTVVSSERYKTDIQDLQLDPTPLLTLPMRSFKYIKDVQEHGEANAPIRHGLIAEEVAAHDPSLEWLIQRDEEGRPDYVNWVETMPQALLKLVQLQAQRIEALEARVTALESK